MDDLYNLGGSNQSSEKDHGKNFEEVLRMERKALKYPILNRMNYLELLGTSFNNICEHVCLFLLL